MYLIGQKGLMVVSLSENGEENSSFVLKTITLEDLVSIEILKREKN